MRRRWVRAAVAAGLLGGVAACGSSAPSAGVHAGPSSTTSSRSAGKQTVQFSGKLTEAQGQVGIGEVSLQAGEGLRWWAKFPDDAKIDETLQFARYNLAIEQNGVPRADTSGSQSFPYPSGPSSEPSDEPSDQPSGARTRVVFSVTPPVFFDYDHSNQWYDGNQALAGVWMTFVAPSTGRYELQVSLALNGESDSEQVRYTGAYSTNPPAQDLGPGELSAQQWTAAVRAQLDFLYRPSNFWPLSGFAFYESASGSNCGNPCSPGPPPPPPAPLNVGPEAHAKQARLAVGG